MGTVDPECVHCLHYVQITHKDIQSDIMSILQNLIQKVTVSQKRNVNMVSLSKFTDLVVEIKAGLNGINASAYSFPA
jgi:hypothetical protein